MNLKEIIEKDYKNICQIVISKDGNIIYELNQNGCNESNKIHVYSVTKSIVSLLIGIAIDHGYISSVDKKVSDYYPSVSSKITIKHLLTMGVHYKYLIPPYIKYFTSKDYVEFSCKLVSESKLGEFSYAPLIGPDILTGILTKSTNMSVFDFANKYLFEPLNIQLKENITFEGKDDQMQFNTSIHHCGWVSDPSGHNTCGWGLTLSAIDLVKIGEMMLNEGKYLEKQIISKEYIQECTSVQNIWKKVLE